MANLNTEVKISLEAIPAKPVRAKKSPDKKRTLVNSVNELRYKMIQDAAYFIAENHHFYGDSQEYWLEAEMQINALLSH